MDAHKKPVEIWQQFDKLLIVLNFKNKESPVSKAAIQAFEQVYKQNSSKLSVLIQATQLSQTHLDPVCCVYDSSSKELVSQVFNFIDLIGGKNQLTVENVEKFLVVRGILEPKGGQLSGKKDLEQHKFVTESSQYAGEAFQLKVDELEALNEQLEEMDRLDNIELKADKIRYDNTLIQVYREIEDPYANQLRHVKYDQNPAEPTELLKEIEFAADGPANGQKAAH